MPVKFPVDGITEVSLRVKNWHIGYVLEAA